MATQNEIFLLTSDFCRAYRCWKSNNQKSSLLICDKLSRDISRYLSLDTGELTNSLVQLKHNVWFLKLRCLADDYYVNESLLLNEDDIRGEDQLRVFSSTKHGRTGSMAHSTSIDTADGVSRRMNTGANKIESRQRRTGILTGRMPSVSSRQSGRATSSYRPLTTSLTATKTAFSRSTRPLLKYAACNLLSKLIFEYLYNAQAITSQCPDYRQCLEYLNLVLNSNRWKGNLKSVQQKEMKSSELHRIVEIDERKRLDAFWLISFGTCYFNLSMNKEAEKYFQFAIAKDPRFLDSYAWLVKIYLRTNQATKVLQTCESGLKYSKNSILFNWMARVQSLMGDLYGTNLNLKKSLTYCPTNIEALANVGHFSFYSDKLEQSLKCFDRIQKLSLNQISNMENNLSMSESAELLNNLALCNFYCGYYHRVMPLFTRSILNSPNKEVTSTIWYNISFIPLNCGFKRLASMCLEMALKINSQNDEAINNLGVLKYGPEINEYIHHSSNKQESLTISSQQNLKFESNYEPDNLDDQQIYEDIYDKAESFFLPKLSESDNDEHARSPENLGQPEMLYNMALVKRRRGQLKASVRYCNLYLEHDHNNFHILKIMSEIKELVSHDN